MKEESYEQKFTKLAPWLNQILNEIKKELKNDHLRNDPQFVQKYFKKKTIDKVTVEELREAYLSELKEGNEEVGDLIASRWVMKNADIYNFFSLKLSEINPKFDEIQEIPLEAGVKMMQVSVSQYGAVASYVFSILNCVKFSESHYAQLRQLAEKESEEQQVEAQNSLEKEESIDSLKARYQKELSRLAEKYENKFMGFQKKYSQDMAGLKKQIASLQRKLNEKSGCCG